MKDENIFTVSEVNHHIRNVIESNIPSLYVEGEISNYTHHRSGHIYFSIKDRESTLRSVFFKGNNIHLKFQPKEGDKVICFGNVTIYERGGNYQLNVRRMMLSGSGELQQKFEALKKKLSAEGLFAEFHKKPLPKFPEKIGVVTSATGAAIQDIKNVIERRFPCKIFLYPATVQGESAAKQVIQGIEYFNEHVVDLLIIGRGGGSQEDLFCFNDEGLARAIFASKIPVISAVGHEIDFTISDFVADLRAPTPSAAAELAVPDKNELKLRISSFSNRINSIIKHQFIEYKLDIQELENRLIKHHPKTTISNMQKQLENGKLRLLFLTKNELKMKRNRLEILSNELKELSPTEILKRGYSLVRLQKKILRSIKDIDCGDKVELVLTDGRCKAEILELFDEDK